MLVIDFETTNLDKGSALNPANRILMVSWYNTETKVEGFYAGDILDAREFWVELNSAQVVCAFNAKFEQHWLARCGFDIDGVQWHDPMLAEKVILGNKPTPKGYLTLDKTCQRYGWSAKDPMIDSMMKAGVCPSEMPQTRLKARCIKDTRTTYSLLAGQLSILCTTGRLHIYRNRCQLTPILTHIEREGMLLDSERVALAYNSHVSEFATLEADLSTVTGGINMNSPKQRAEYLYDTLKFPEKKSARGKPMRTPAGGRLTDYGTMAWLVTQAKTAKQNEFIKLSQKYAKAHAALSKNLEFFYGVCAEYHGKFTAQFNQIVAATHRLTSSGRALKFDMFPKPKSVQFQNMPREFKNLFTAPSGYVIIEVDAMQLEFRVAAFLGQCKQALSDIADPDFDAHIFSASKINDLTYAGLLSDFRGENGREAQSLAKVRRQQAKPHTFKPLYGGTKGTPEEERYYKAFAERYKGIANQQQKWLGEVMQNGFLKLPWGMTFFWQTYIKNGIPFCKRTHKPVGPQVFNYPVQSLATAEIVPIAITSLWSRCKGLDVKFVNTVHDSVICYVAEADVDSFKFAAEQAFTHDVYAALDIHYGIDFNVPLGCEIVVGKHWTEGESFTYDDVQKRAAA